MDIKGKVKGLFSFLEVVEEEKEIEEPITNQTVENYTPVKNYNNVNNNNINNNNNNYQETATKLPTVLYDELFNEDIFTTLNKDLVTLKENPAEEKNSNIKEKAEVTLDYQAPTIVVEQKESEPQTLYVEHEETQKVVNDYNSSTNSDTTKSYYEENRVFVPSQTISPVYGILDKNYKKEDIKVKDERLYEIPRRRCLDYEDVRKKAYGTLTDEIELALSEENLKIKNTINDLDNLLSNINKNETVAPIVNQVKENSEPVVKKDVKNIDNTIDVSDIFDITIPNIQIRKLEYDEDRFDKTMADVPLSADIEKEFSIQRVNNIEKNEHNNKSESIDDLINQFYKEGES